MPVPPMLDSKTVQPLAPVRCTSSVLSVVLNEVYVGSTTNTWPESKSVVRAW